MVARRRPAAGGVGAVADVVTAITRSLAVAVSLVAAILVARRLAAAGRPRESVAPVATGDRVGTARTALPYGVVPTLDDGRDATGR